MEEIQSTTVETQFPPELPMANWEAKTVPIDVDAPVEVARLHEALRNAALPVNDKGEPIH